MKVDAAPQKKVADEMTGTKQVFMRIPGDTFFLDLVRKVVVDLATKMKFPKDDVSRIEIAVDEACTNVMKHAIRKRSVAIRSGNPENCIDMSVGIDTDKILVSICDRGAYFDFNSKGNIDLEKYLKKMQLGGLGIYVIKNFMDEAVYKHKKGFGNELKLVKYLRKTPVS